ncbi:galactitol-1-phosphate 5-dehydrogenase [Christensenellaceae bacterium OttesenSCG-928-K19]|nr:galactitol-1-phosphate 5-dehydrogenase [Christensenellaceae bacterium OttesenSCG-928-K19]
MKAVRMYKPGDLRVEDVPVPAPKDNEALVRVMACGVCGSDIPRVNKYGAHIAPLTIGHEFAGKIVEVGKDVKGFKVGDKVTVPPLIPCYKCEWCEKGIYSLCEDYDYFGSRRDGAMAEYVAVPEPNLLKVPDNVSYLDAATTDPCGNALHGIAQANLKPGEVFVAYGAGPIGLFAVQVAKEMGASKVFAVDMGDEKCKVAKECGADVVIDASKEDPVEVIKRETNGSMADVVIDFTGAPVAQKKAIDCAGKMARVVLLGISHQGLNLEEKQVDNIMRGQISVIGSWNSFTKPFPGDDWFKGLELFEKGAITAKPMISHKLSLDEAPDMFKAIDKGGIFFNKILFLPHGEEAGEE